MKIVIDAFGGDNAPYEIVKGAIKAVKKFADLNVVLCGDKSKIETILSDTPEKLKNKIEIIDAKDIITNDDIPTLAIRQKTESSLVKSFDALKTDDSVDGLLSAGSTGAVLTGSILKLGRIAGVSRPALAPVLPTKKAGTKCMLIDCGANVDSKPINLVHFALMANEYMKTVFGVKEPKVAMLNIGTEDHKGNDLCHQTFPMLKQLPINFVGNCEARDALSGDYNVIVCDGFAGNVFLKSLEGAFSLVFGEIKKGVKKGIASKIGAMFMRSTFKKLKNKLDYNKIGGAPFMGVKKLVVKAHGASKCEAIYSALCQMHTLVQGDITGKIAKSIESVDLNFDEGGNA